MPKAAKTLNLYEAKTQLSRLVDEAAAGAEIIIAKAGRPKARLVSLAPTTIKRRPGVAKGRIHVGPNFDDPLPPDILAAFLGEDE